MYARLVGALVIHHNTWLFFLILKSLYDRIKRPVSLNLLRFTYVMLYNNQSYHYLKEIYL